jgi:hypothetical protein
LNSASSAFAARSHGIRNWVSAINMHDGKVTNRAVADTFDLEYLPYAKLPGGVTVNP